MKIRHLFILTSILILGFFSVTEVLSYPIDGYEYSGIRRLRREQLILKGDIKGKQPIAGALKSIKDIKLNLLGLRGDSVANLPVPDPNLQKGLNALFPNLSSNYSIALLDISEGKPMRYAERKSRLTYQPGSVGKLAVIAGFFCELQSVFPDSFEKRIELMRTHIVQAGQWALPNIPTHTVHFFDTSDNKYRKRILVASDTFSLFEWTDNMLSVSNNGAASVVWREAMLMHVFGPEYPQLNQVDIDSFFKETPKKELTEIGMSVVNDPLRDLGISDREWQLGSFFTRGAKSRVRGTGGSRGSPAGLMKFMIALERGKICDEESSLEIKRLMYMTDRRIRYGGAPAISDAALYFKSGSLYKCKKDTTETEPCGKYKGNVYNYMNSVAIVEQPDSITYMVALMSNVLGKNSGWDHRSLATRIDKLVRK